MSRPTVSVLLPTLNEQDHIQACLASLAAQDERGILEILVLDGGSRDATRELAREAGGLVRVLDNPGRTAAAAMNLGIAEARGTVIVRADAHTTYASDYVRCCVDVLLETGAANVGGRMRPTASSRFGRAVAAVTSSPFGVGPGRFHYSDERSDVDTVYLGCWRKATLAAVGGFDAERLQWGAEDDELNLRIAQNGGRIVLDPTIRSWYVPRESPGALWNQYFNYGVGKASVLVKHHRLATWRPLAPATLVAASVVGLALATRRPGWAGLPFLHAVGTSVVAARVAASSDARVIDTFLAIEVCHWSYGAGFWTGIWRGLRGVSFDSAHTRPTVGG